MKVAALSGGGGTNEAILEEPGVHCGLTLYCLLCCVRVVDEGGGVLTYKGLPVKIILDAKLFPDDHPQRRVLLEFRKEDAKKIQAIPVSKTEGPWVEPIKKGEAPRYQVTLRSLDEAGRLEYLQQEGSL